MRNGLGTGPIIIIAALTAAAAAGAVAAAAGAVAAGATAGPAAADRATDPSGRMTVEGVLAVAYHAGEASGGEDGGRFDGGGMPIQIGLRYRPEPRDVFFVKLGFAAGRGVRAASPFVLAPWAADLEDDVVAINGRQRDYLLTAWYRRTLVDAPGHSLAVTGGIVDATDYLDINVLANDEYTQFLNTALVNGPNFFAPSYDIGAALEWERGRLSVNGVVMELGENEDGRPYRFAGVQLGWRVGDDANVGNYRAILGGTSADDLDPRDGSRVRRTIALISCDQQLNDLLGVWIRCGVQDDDASIDYRDIYSGGLDLAGAAWGRPGDNLGLGYGRLGGGNRQVESTDALELYVRIALTGRVHATGDVQYLEDDLRNAPTRHGWLLGVRLTSSF